MQKGMSGRIIEALDDKDWEDLVYDWAQLLSDKSNSIHGLQGDAALMDLMQRMKRADPTGRRMSREMTDYVNSSDGFTTEDVTWTNGAAQKVFGKDLLNISELMLQGDDEGDW